MAILQHSTLPSGITHEPKHISLNSTAATGKVITNSSSSTGVSEYRKLTQADLEDLEVLWQVQEFDGSVQQTHYLPTTFTGEIVKWDGIVNIAVAGGSNTYELQIDAVQVTGTPITFTTGGGTGGTAGDILSANASAANLFNGGSVVTIVNTSTANTETALDIRFIITVKRT
jgi:hypothetical protein